MRRRGGCGGRWRGGWTAGSREGTAAVGCVKERRGREVGGLRVGLVRVSAAARTGEPDSPTTVEQTETRPSREAGAREGGHPEGGGAEERQDRTAEAEARTRTSHPTSTSVIAAMNRVQPSVSISSFAWTLLSK